MKEIKTVYVAHPTNHCANYSLKHMKENILIPHVPTKWQYKSGEGKPFSYLTCNIPEVEILQKMHQLSSTFDFIQTYVDPLYKTTDGKVCIAIRTNGVIDITTATIEMNAVSSRNKRCVDPLFSFILSWPESENPDSDAIFDAAEHSIKALGLSGHQYIIAVHGDTDNMHCHVAVNRVHPITFRSHKIEWSIKTLHLAARESEIKHGWSHDNGIYVVKTNKNNQKRIVLIRKMPTPQPMIKSLHHEKII